MTKKLIAIVAVMALAAGVFAQGGGGGGRGGFGGQRGGMFGGGGSTGLLRRDDVKDELKLSADQTTKIADVFSKERERRQEAMQSAGINFGGGGGGGGFQMDDDTRKKMTAAMEKVNAETKKDIEAILTPEQTKRLRELAVQRAGNSAAADPEFQKDLNVTDDQKAKIADLQKKQGEAMMAFFQKMRDGELDRDGMREAMTKNQKIMSDEIAKLLTDAQKAKIKEMSGAAFTFKDNPGGGR